MLLLLKCLKSVDDMIAIGHNTLAYASLGSDDFVELENDMPSEVIVHTRDEWKKQLSSRDLMKALGKAKMIGMLLANAMPTSTSAPFNISSSSAYNSTTSALITSCLHSAHRSRNPS